MGYLHSSGAISLSQVQSHWGGGNPIAMSEYYRNGSYVPSIYTVTTTTTTTTRQPTSGNYFTLVDPAYYWQRVGTSARIRWNGVDVATGVSVTASSHTTGGWTYYIGAVAHTIYTATSYRVHRQQTTTSTSTTTTNINTGIPSSGQISMSQFYGGRN